MYMKSLKRSRFDGGQAIVIVLLSLSVVLTIVLFILSRSVTDIATSNEQADSVRAFSAAEAGIEKALIIAESFGGEIGNASYTVAVSDLSEGTSTFNYPISLSSGDSMTLWFISHNQDGTIAACDATHTCFTGNTLKICWGNAGAYPTPNLTPAIEVSAYYETTPGTISTVQIGRGTYDPIAGTRTPPNSFTASDNIGTTCRIGEVTYAFQKTITLSTNLKVTSSGSQGGLLFARIRMLYNTDAGHVIGASVDFPGNSVLPSQGLDIVSTGIAGTSGSESNRRVNVFKGWPEFPFGGLAVYTPYGITKSN